MDSESAALDFERLFRIATAGDEKAGVSPYRYQYRLAFEGLSEIVKCQTGSGKTLAVFMAWLYRRLFHPDPNVREATPRRLIWCLPMRALTEQTERVIKEALTNLRLIDDIPVHVLMGGRELSQDWRIDLHRDTVLICTIDMAVSRSLNRGYRSSLSASPIDFALFNNDAHWVLDETQLMGPALATTRQLHGLRSKLGVGRKVSSTWMSATIDPESLDTVDAPFERDDSPTDQSLGDDPDLKTALGASKQLRCRRIDDPSKYAVSFADIVVSEHMPGSMTIVVVNRVDTAREIAKALLKKTDTPITLLHSRFRPVDRQMAMNTVLTSQTSDHIVVATQVIEAGVSISAQTLLSEAAPRSSLVQRAGRCNRFGTQEHAKFIVVEPGKNSPYDMNDVESAWTTCLKVDGAQVSPVSIEQLLGDAIEHTPITPVLRRQDLLELFDTSPDLSGNVVDVSQFIRDGEDIDVAIAWRQLFDENGNLLRHEIPTHEELCPVQVWAFRLFMKSRIGPKQAWFFDHVDNEWREVTPQNLRPGMVILVDTRCGGYTSQFGFDRASKTMVEEVVARTSKMENITPLEDTAEPEDDAMNTGLGESVLLSKHLLDAETAANELCEQLGLDETTRSIVARASRLHDLGKAHSVWQTAIHKIEGTADADEPGKRNFEPVLAKSSRRGSLVFSQKGFRHELVSALAVLQNPELAGECDTDLIAYLVAAHHGKVRMRLQPTQHDNERSLRGVIDGDVVDSVDLGDGWKSPPTTVNLDFSHMGLTAEGQASWSERTQRLLHEYGPFRLAWLEMLVRIADWRASTQIGLSAGPEVSSTLNEVSKGEQ